MYGAPLEYVRWEIAEQFGWTLPEIDALTVADLHALAQINDARGKVQEERKRRGTANR